MASIFLTYARDDQAVSEGVAHDLQILGHKVWYDRELTGGQSWWNEVLEHIREISVLLVILSPSSLRSQACKLEWTYALALHKNIIPVLAVAEIDMALLPPALANLHCVNRSIDDKKSLLELLKSISQQPLGRPLPNPLPPAPPVPLSYLGLVKAQIDVEDELSRKEQWDVVGRLKTALREGDNVGVVTKLLKQLRQREDTYAVVAVEIDHLLDGNIDLVMESFAKKAPSNT